MCRSLLCADRGALHKAGQGCSASVGVLTAFCFAQNIPTVLQVQLFDLRSRPWRFSQKLQTGLDARVVIKAPDLDDLAQFLPAVVLHQPGKHHFQGDAVKRIFLLLVVHSHPISLLH